MIARVLPDVPAIDKTFDYVVPDGWPVAVGTRVRVPLQGRRVGGWVVALNEAPATDRALKPLAKLSGIGPSPELIDLARWAAWRWAGRTATFLRTASPPVVIPGSRPWRSAIDRAPGAGTVVERLPPAADMPAAVSRALPGWPGRTSLVLAPTGAMAQRLARDLRGLLMPRDWAQVVPGSIVVGTRAAAWAPAPELGGVVVVDEHDEAYQEERAPTWNARDVAVERARRNEARCVLFSPAPSLEALGLGELVVPSRTDERSGWPVIEVVDRRREPPGLGLFSKRLVTVARDAERIVCVLNRKGRARLLACQQCGELARCENCGAAVQQLQGALSCPRCGLERPLVCAACGASRLKVLRAGVTRVREELEALVRRPVAEITADAPDDLADAAVVVGTEAALHRVRRADVVAFLDFDQELLAPRYRAAEQAMALLIRAARLVGGRDRGRLLLQTRIPNHETIDAALHADPSRLSVVESARRAALRLPPETALALVSGEAADDYVSALRARLDVEVMGPSASRWLVRAADHQLLCDALAATPRPAGRLRVEVDPLRA